MINYNLLDKIIHKISFNQNVQKILYEIEKKIFLKKTKKNYKAKNIFITGLARSGTTTLLNYIYQSNNYASLTYSDMPLILSTNINKIFFNNKKINTLERYHNDSIKFNLKSPEAFDEVFFLMFKNDNLKFSSKLKK